MSETYEIIVLDLDGTLTNSKKVITPKTKDALMRIQKEGKKVVLASGRPTGGIVKHLMVERLLIMRPERLYTIRQYR